MPGPLAALLVVVALAVSVAGGWLFTVAMLRLASRTGPRRGTGTVDAQAAAAEAAAAPDGPRARTVLRGGTWIGVLERVAVTGAVMLDQPEGLAVVVAVKGLGRFPELQKEPVASERFVIGTLASLVFAAGVGLAARALLLPGA
ncbi:hypothetical protein [Cellulomonas endophytica]|uniref:hypothetical protein n=1 Tax=Cellulomonas endophytica TaxID=2494735 RepID=UPI0010113CBD|nr:hypothetical protein [Cellulomonas endophytica]